MLHGAEIKLNLSKYGAYLKCRFPIAPKIHLESEGVKRSVEWLIRMIVKVASRVPYHSRYWWVHGDSAFPLCRHY